MPLETLQLLVSGRSLPHTTAELTELAEDAVRSASFTVAVSGDGLPCRPDDNATIMVSGELWGTGYVRDVNVDHDAESRSCTVTFVSKTCDAVEASIDHATGLAKDCTIKDIAETFDTYGVGIEGDGGSEKKARHKVNPGETLLETLETDARARGVLIHDTPKGKLRLAKKPEGRHAGSLRLGVTIKSASGRLTGRNSCSAVKVRGQNSEGTTGTSLRPEAEAAGSSPRQRIFVVPHEGEATEARMKERARWEAKRAAGRNVECEVTTVGFRDAGGKLWTRNFLVEVDDAWLGIQQDMVIAAVTFSQDSEVGTIATLSLKDPRALGGDNPRGKSDGAWSAPAAAATFREE